MAEYNQAIKDSLKNQKANNYNRTSYNNQEDEELSKAIQFSLGQNPNELYDFNNAEQKIKIRGIPSGIRNIGNSIVK